MSGGLPATIEPIRLADKGVDLRGEISLQGMTRLEASLRDKSGTASVDLAFRRDTDRGGRRVTGTISASLVVTCERCLEPLPLDLTADVDFLIVSADAGRETDDTVDALEVEGPMALRDLVENELVLALPMIPMHALEACPAAQWIEESDAQQKREEAGDVYRPFEGLAGMKPGDAKR
jgi:uncharacterized protein